MGLSLEEIRKEAKVRRGGRGRDYLRGACVETLPRNVPWRFRLKRFD